VCIFAPLVGAGAIAGERERGTLTTLLAAPLSRFRILTGKVVAVLFYVLLMLSVSLPIAALSLLFGGADFPTLLGVYLTHAILGLCFGCLGIAASTLFARTWTASLVAIGIAFGLGLFTLSFFVALDGFTHWRDESKMLLLRSILAFNPGYGLVLFFMGDTPEFGLRSFWEHYAALMALAGLSFAFAARRLARE
jgi:ABC-type transport system involved in multi-copper enzyme maturation permease subunit